MQACGQPLHTTLLAHTSSVQWLFTAAPLEANSHAARPELAGPAGAQRDIGHLPASFEGRGRHATLAKCTVAGLACNHCASFSKKLLNERLARVSAAGGESWEPSTATFFAERYLGFLHTRLSTAVPQLDNGVLTCGKTL